MFLQAGFNPRVRGTRIVALVWHRRARWRERRAAELVQFRSGDFAWWGGRGISWPESLAVANLVHVDFWSLPEPRCPTCELP